MKMMLRFFSYSCYTIKLVIKTQWFFEMPRYVYIVNVYFLSLGACKKTNVLEYLSHGVLQWRKMALHLRIFPTIAHFSTL